jgi:hypothetical protein
VRRAAVHQTDSRAKLFAAIDAVVLAVFRSINDDDGGSKSSITGGAKGYHQCLALKRTLRHLK